MWRTLKVELLQCLHRRESRFLNPPRHRLAIPFLDLGFQQRLQITQVRLLLFHGLFGQVHELIAQRWQVQLFGILQDRGLLQWLGSAHWITSVASQLGRNRSYLSRLGRGRSYRLSAPMSIGLAVGSSSRLTVNR